MRVPVFLPRRSAFIAGKSPQTFLYLFSGSAGFRFTRSPLRPMARCTLRGSTARLYPPPLARYSLRP